VQNGPVERRVERTSAVQNGLVERKDHNFHFRDAMKAHEHLLESSSSLLSNATGADLFGSASKAADLFSSTLVIESSVCMKFKLPCKTVPIYRVSWYMLHME